ncbi:hypothetical protein [Microvirga makkahensis]|uniref:Uncharacterized protein n=1 Tax=Microvirga makkahensis TaxID=1128670 RepID=A0A7X3MXG1_9HYPH|nr:hypothetical protein [Microvirga makkahensis]MXQ14833.1 hypothetical protein [Microvirga makkahensis]
MVDDSNIQAQEKQASAEIGEDMVLQERTWMAQRIGWWAMGLILLAALAGLLATGPLSWSEARDSTGALRVEYERFQRHMAPSTLRLHLSPEAVSGGTVLIHVSDGFADAMRIEKIVPEPEQAKVTPTGLEYAFAAAEPGKAASIRFFLSSERFGSVEAEVGLSGREPARLSMFIYP